MSLVGLPEWEAAMARIVLEMEAAEKKAVSDSAKLQQQSVRANMTGSPRWVGHQNTPRSGGPGVLTGRLMASVKEDVRSAGPGRYSAELTADTVYAARTERRYPYFTPGVRAADRGVERIFAEYYSAVIR